MTKKFKEPLDDKWRDALLGEDLLGRLNTERRALGITLASIRKLLLSNPLVQLAADKMADECNLIGEAAIRVDDHGSFWLEVNGHKRRAARSVESLMQEAQSLGVDTSHLSLSQTPKSLRSRLVKAIQRSKQNAAEQEAAKSQPKKPYMKTAPAIRVLPQIEDPDAN